MSPLNDHEMWLSLVHFCFFSPCSVFLVVFFCFLWVFCFLGCLLLFSVGVLGAWHYVYHQLTMIERDFWMLLKLGNQIWKERAGLVTLMWLLFHGKSELGSVEYGLPENGRYMALGPYWGFQHVWMKCLRGLIGIWSLRLGGLEKE